MILESWDLQEGLGFGMEHSWLGDWCSYKKKKIRSTFLSLLLVRTQWEDGQLWTETRSLPDTESAGAGAEIFPKLHLSQKQVSIGYKLPSQ